MYHSPITTKSGIFFQITKDPASKTCPSGTNPPTFNGENAPGFLLLYGEYNNPTDITYTVRYENGLWGVFVECEFEFSERLSWTQIYCDRRSAGLLEPLRARNAGAAVCAAK